MAAAVPASHALRITAAAFETLYNVRLVTGAALVLLSSLVSLLGFSAFERLRHTFMAKAAELGVFFLVPTGLPNSADKGAELVTMAEPGFIWNLICAALAVVASTALWHAAVRANSSLLTQRASLITAAFGCLNPRQVLLLAADLSMNISIIFMALYLGGSLQLKPHECMTPGKLSVGNLTLKVHHFLCRAGSFRAVRAVQQCTCSRCRVVGRNRGSSA